ncbi:MAG: cobalt-precorrin 5A hydrolase [Eubacterium sp.]|nr:cobalt-precorrin 5A hydrolase [Eubacterium sp.]
MKIAGICFTQSGERLAEQIRSYFEKTEDPGDLEMSWYVKSKFADADRDNGILPLAAPVKTWAEEQFREADVIIFIGATGIAVRIIAPFVRDKRTDPAVICLDEKGKFCISLLSGHIGGANRLVSGMSGYLGSTPVITTATDINQKFAVDVYAKENGISISNMTYAKEVSAALLSGEPVGFYTSFPVEGRLPEGIYWSDKLMQAREDHGEEIENGISLGIYISPSYARAYFDHTLWLIPKCLVLGIGCKKGTPAEQIERFVEQTLKSYSLYQEAVSMAASIDVKKDEPGILSYCRTHGLPFRTYSAEELKAVPGKFSHSDFVEQKVGVDNVCERSAIRAGGRHLLISKTSRNGITLAVAMTNYKVYFED